MFVLDGKVFHLETSPNKLLLFSNRLARHTVETEACRVSKLDLRFLPLLFVVCSSSSYISQLDLGVNVLEHRLLLRLAITLNVFQ